MRVREIGARSGYVGNLLRCRLSWDGPDDAAPRSVVVKLPSDSARARRVCRILSLYRREYDFYRFVGPSAPVASPAMFYGRLAGGGGRSVLVLEDLGHLEFFDRSHAASAEQARTVVRAMARLHGTYWGSDHQEPLSRIYRYDAFRNRVLIHLGGVLSAEPVLRRFQEVLPAGIRALAEAYVARLDQHFVEFASKPATFVHGDCHLSNLVFDAAEPRKLTVIDWQVSGISCGMEDIATFMVTGPSIETRRLIETELLREYHHIVREMGAREYAFGECWHTYRQYVLSRLVTIAIAVAVVDPDDDGAMRASASYIRRLSAAIHDLRADELLPGRPRFWSVSGAFGTASSAAHRTAKRLHRVRRSGRPTR